MRVAAADGRPCAFHDNRGERCVPHGTIFKSPPTSLAKSSPFARNADVRPPKDFFVGLRHHRRSSRRANRVAACLSASSSYPWNSALNLATIKKFPQAVQLPSVAIFSAVFDSPTTSSASLASPRNVLRSVPFLFPETPLAHRRYYSSDTILRAVAAPDLRQRRDNHH